MGQITSLILWMERSAFDFEVKFAGWLADTQPKPLTQPIVYQTASPFQRRTVIIPTWVVAPPQEFSVVCLSNSTNIKINYSITRENEPWQSASVEAGQSRWHSWALEGGVFDSPALTVSFDGDASDRVFIRTYTLSPFRTSTPNCDTAKQYTFSASANDISVGQGPPPTATATQRFCRLLRVVNGTGEPLDVAL